MPFDPGQPPQRYLRFTQRYPELFEAYERLGSRLREAGPLDAKTLRLTKLAMAIGARLKGAVFAHARLAVSEGCSPEEVRHTAVLALSTLGLPHMMAALSWVDEVLDNLESQSLEGTSSDSP
jgi:alkylhydroperoxidase/carboxymuconolactone decarboxylase family protein YurZ